MRVLVDLAENQLHALDAAAKRAGRSRAALVRDAVAEFLARQRSGANDDAFGLWRGLNIDGLDYQEELRREW